MFCALYIYSVGLPFPASTLTAKVLFYRHYKEGKHGVSLVVVTQEFRCVFQLFFRLHLYRFHSELANKLVTKSKPSLSGKLPSFRTLLGLQIYIM